MSWGLVGGYVLPLKNGDGEDRVEGGKEACDAM